MNASTSKMTAKKSTLVIASGLLMAGLAVGCVSKKEPEWLFVLTSKHGEIAKSAQGQYTLTLEDKHMQRVLMFSNRPYRLGREISVTQLKDIWGKGDDSFEKDPPNAAVVINGSSQPVVLTSINVTPGQVQFTVRQDGEFSIRTSSGAAEVFIDNPPPGYD